VDLITTARAASAEIRSLTASVVRFAESASAMGQALTAARGAKESFVGPGMIISSPALAYMDPQLGKPLPQLIWAVLVFDLLKRTGHVPAPGTRFIGTKARQEEEFLKLIFGTFA
jgi:hypothetical protein